MISLELRALNYLLYSLYVLGSPGCNCVRHAATYSGSSCHGTPVEYLGILFDDMMKPRMTEEVSIMLIVDSA